MFLLRCTFWLSIVYASMSWGGNALQHHGGFAAAAATRSAMRDGAAERAVASVTGFCQDHQAPCLKDAALMTTLVETTLQTDADEAIVQDAAEVPAPMPAPRRRVASAVLTRLR